MTVHLLLDENLSEHLLPGLTARFPGSAHVRTLGMGGASDSDLWNVAQRGGFLLVTKDEDFVTLSVLRGHPPKVVWLNIGNASTDDTLAVLLRQADAIFAFAEHVETSFLALALQPSVAQSE